MLHRLRREEEGNRMMADVPEELRDKTEVPLEDLSNVPVCYLQNAYYQRGANAAELASNLGWFHSRNGGADSSRALRAIGLRPMHEPKNGEEPVYRPTVKYALAIRILEALHFDAVDYGL